MLDIDWEKVKLGVLSALHSMRAPPAIQARRANFRQAAAQVDGMSAFAAEAIHEFQIRGFQPAVRDSELEALADELITKWQSKAQEYAKRIEEHREEKEKKHHTC